MTAESALPADGEGTRRVRLEVAYLGDGNFGGRYARPDDDMLALWAVAVEETRALLAGDWGGPA